MPVQIRGFARLFCLVKSLLLSSFIALLLCAYSNEAFSETSEAKVEKNDAHKAPPFFFDNKPWYLVGKATLTWGFWDIYDSALFTLTGQFLDNKYQADALSLLLLIKYQKNFSANSLLDATAEQWAHLGIDEQKIKRWEKAMTGSWPAIEKGDKLYYLYNGMKGQFFYQQKNKKPYLYSEITNKAQAKAFIAIWLSPHTAYPKLRAALIGQKK